MIVTELLTVACVLLPLCWAQYGNNYGYQDQQPYKPQGPVFISHPPDTVEFANTRGASIPCTAFGRPAPVLQWVDEFGKPIDEVEELLHVFPNNTLYLPPFHAEQFLPKVHQRTYRCTAANAAGTVISRNVTVRAVLVDQYRNYDVQLSDKWVVRGNTAVMRCAVYPAYVKAYVQVTGWTQSTKKISPGARVSVLPDGVLHIRDVRNEDQMSMYTCTTRNVLTGDEKSSGFAYLRVHDPPAGGEKPVIKESINSLTIQQGETVEIPCVSSQSYPVPSYVWVKDGITLDMTYSSHYQQLEGNLVIANSSVRDTGRYVCAASNEHGSDQALTILTVFSSLSVHVEPVEQTVDAGNAAIFNCTYEGHPIRSIAWYKDGAPLVNDSRVVFRSETVLVVNDVRRNDQGMYQCFVGNANETVQGAAQLSLGAAMPQVVDAFQELFVQRGQQVTLRCKFSGNPSPSVTWQLDGTSLPNDPRIATNSFTTPIGDVISYVNISRVEVPYGGEYWCFAVNNVGRAEHGAKLNVYGTPYIKPLPNVTATASKRLTLRCYVSGFPIYTINWSRGGRVLPVNHLQRVVKGALIIETVQNEDAGMYTCTANNRDGQEVNRSVFVTVVEPPVIDPFSFPQRKQGDRIVVTCVISSGDLPITISWEKDNKPIPHDLGVMVQKLGAYSSMLSIADASPRHDGNYTCHANNAASSASYTAPLHVDVPPRWVVEPEDSFVVLDNSVQLDCQTAGTPDPRIEWKKAEDATSGSYQPVQLEGRGDHMTQLPNGTLRIIKALEEDHGYYLCHASNGIGIGISKVVFLRVHIPARFNEPKKNYTVRKDNNITMECQAVGDKPLSVSWSYNGMPVSTSHPRSMVITQNTPRGALSQLTLQPAMRNDTGFYTCNAKNKFGHGTLVSYLIVNEPPGAVSKVDVTNVTSRSVSVRWTKPFDGNNALLYYIVQYKNETDVWQGLIQNVTVEAKRQEGTISNLLPSFSYHIRVIANNSIGRSPPSEVIIATTLEEAPSGPPLDVEVKAIGSQDLLVKWQAPAKGIRNGQIQGYYIGYKDTQGGQQFTYITKTTEPLDGEDVVLQHTIHNLHKFTEYTVHVKAYNTEGISPASGDIVVFTLEDVPSQPPKNVQATPLSSRSIRVAWSPPPLYTLHGILQGYKVLYKPVREDEDESDANFMTSSRLEVILYNLERYTNYSVQVLAYTRKGEGVRSDPIFITTMQDVPEAPLAIKALPVNSSSILAAWQPPDHPNGILTHYTLYYRNSSVPVTQEQSLILPAKVLNVRLPGLREDVEYFFRVTASTVMGEGETTQFATATPKREVPARIASFPASISVPWHQQVTLHCLAVGWPLPYLQWSLRGQVVRVEGRYRIHDNGSLTIEGLTTSDVGNYTCMASNMIGDSHVTYPLNVIIGDHSGSPPQPPRLNLVLTTTSTIQVNWLSGSNGGNPILGFVLNYKKEHNGWKPISLGPTNRTHIAVGLMCGTQYRFVIHAFNSKGDSSDSNVVEARTNGSVPIMPPQSMLLKEINVTTATLDVTSWQISGCPIRFFSVKYRLWEDTEWTNVNDHIPANITQFTVQDLHPATWYVMQVTAYSDAGSTDSELKFATLTYTGSTIKPVYVMERQHSEFYQQVHVMLPLCGTIVVAMVVGVAIFLFFRRRKYRMRYKETSSNLRRDLTVETSLMNDLDKRLNTDLDSSSSSMLPEPYPKQRNVNLSSPCDDNLHSSSQMPLFLPDISKTSSDNGSLNGRSFAFNDTKDESNINPYATFNEVRQQQRKEQQRLLKQQQQQQQKRQQATSEKRSKKRPEDFVDHLNKSSEDDDNISIQKHEAREGLLSTPSESYVPFFQTKEDVYKVPHTHRTKSMRYKKQPPPLPAPRKTTTKTEALMVHRENVERSRGLILTPRRYASADHIHALFTAPPRPQSAVKSGSGSGGGSGSSDKTSQRNSLLSSVTTVSSSRDELLEALENAKRHPPPPVLYESQPESSSQPTDSSVATEPGIREFTQSPPRPNEQREASCEVPPYERELEKRRPRPAVRRAELSSDTTECEGGEMKERSPPRRVRGRHRGKQRGQVTNKRQLGTTFVPRRTNSRNSTTSSEEVTYSFGGAGGGGLGIGVISGGGGGDMHNSPGRCYSPYYNSGQRPPAYPAEGYAYGGPPPVVPTVKRSSGGGGRTTPHGKLPPVGIHPNSPPCHSLEERHPMLIKVPPGVLSSPAEEEERVSLLDRHYRPVPEEDSELEGLSAAEAGMDKGYTDDFTIV